MGRCTKANGRKTANNLKELEFISTQMELCIKVNLKMDFIKDMEGKSRVVEAYTRVIGTEVRNKDMVS